MVVVQRLQASLGAVRSDQLAQVSDMQTQLCALLQVAVLPGPVCNPQVLLQKLKDDDILAISDGIVQVGVNPVSLAHGRSLGSRVYTIGELLRLVLF